MQDLLTYTDLSLRPEADAAPFLPDAAPEAVLGVVGGVPEEVVVGGVEVVEGGEPEAAAPVAAPPPVAAPVAALEPEVPVVVGLGVLDAAAPLDAALGEAWRAAAAPEAEEPPPAAADPAALDPPAAGSGPQQDLQQQAAD